MDQQEQDSGLGSDFRIPAEQRAINRAAPHPAAVRRQRRAQQRYVRLKLARYLPGLAVPQMQTGDAGP